ncbi:MAG: hypothetical protein EBY29_07695 [Planctomycetes bacterium]|nr:hypothetical protein [Planctomycetota bacterium]
MSLDVKDGRPAIKMSMAELIAAIALIATVFSSLNGWIVLPEQMRQVRNENERQDIRLNAIERLASERSETLARIDERTKRIEESLKTK